ncbi:MAG: hypothetical protein ACE5LU_03805 [Anaerolineae bacterium]
MREIERDDVVEMAARTQCALCKIPYGRHGVRVLGRRSGAWVIAVTCAHCETEGLMVATVDEGERGIVSIDQETDARPKIMYDVTYDEWLAFQKQPRISHDDVLDTHTFLKDFKGDFAQLFGGETNTEDKVR